MIVPLEVEPPAPNQTPLDPLAIFAINGIPEVFVSTILALLAKNAFVPNGVKATFDIHPIDPIVPFPELVGQSNTHLVYAGVASDCTPFGDPLIVLEPTYVDFVE